MVVTTPTRDEPATSHLPAETGVWVFILGDMTVFAVFFATFIFYRSGDVALFNASQLQLNQNLGAMNTLLLLTSSWFVVRGVSAGREGKLQSASGLFSTALLCGLGFGVVKIIEYSEKLQHGITPLTNDFFMYYFVFTGIHLIHVIIGCGLLLGMILHCRKHVTGDANRLLLEGGASFWHMVDLLWIVLFPLIYLMK